MGKLTRVQQKQFGSTGPSGDFGVFGSLAAGNKTFSQDPATIQSLSAFLQGLGQSVIGNYEPPMEDINGLFLLLFRQICYTFQEGLPEWETNTTYYIGSLTKVNGQIFNSIVDNNLGNNPSTDNGTNWLPGIGGASGGVATGAGLPYFGMSNVIPAGYLLCDGSAVSRTTYSALYNSIGTSYGPGNGTTTFNLPNSRGKVLVGADGTTEFLTPGQLGGEKYHQLTVAELASHTHPNSFNSFAPNNVGSNGNGQFGNTGSTGGDQPHNNLQPYLVIGGIIIKT